MPDYGPRLFLISSLWAKEYVPAVLNPPQFHLQLLLAHCFPFLSTLFPCGSQIGQELLRRTKTAVTFAIVFHRALIRASAFTLK